MEDNPAIYKIAQSSSGFTVDNVVSKFNTGVPQAASFGFQVSIFFMATILAITFVKFLLNRD